MAKSYIRTGSTPSVPVQSTNNLPSLTRQSMTAECNINNIMAKFKETGVIEHTNEHKGQYGDFTEVTDYHTALTHVTKAQAMFLSLPAKLRAQFGNDPGEFLHFTNDPENIDEMRKMGLLPKLTRSEQDEAATGGEAKAGAGEAVQANPEPPLPLEPNTTKEKK